MPARPPYRGQRPLARKGIAAALLVFATTALLAQERGIVTAVEDGDTITVKISTRSRQVRLLGIDAPEICHPKHDPGCSERPGQPFGKASGDSLRSLVQGKEVTLDCKPGVDRYQRLLCDVHVGETDVAREQVHRGMAWSDAHGVKAAPLKAAELAARLGQRGLWSEPTPVRPSDWRRACWRNGFCPGAQNS